MDLETATFHGGITLASILVLTALDGVAKWKKYSNPPSSIRQQLRHVLVLLPPCVSYRKIDLHTFLFAYCILRSRSSCFLRSCRSGDRRCRRTSLAPLTCTR